MERIIGGVVYNTEMAEKILSAGEGNRRETLYRGNQNLHHFLLLEKGEDKWIVPKSRDEARKWLEDLNQDLAVQRLKEYFSDDLKEA